MLFDCAMRRVDTRNIHPGDDKLIYHRRGNTAGPDGADYFSLARRNRRRTFIHHICLVFLIFYVPVAARFGQVPVF